MVIIVPGWGWLHFIKQVTPMEKALILLFSLQPWVNCRTDWALQSSLDDQAKRRKTLNSNLLNSTQKLTVCHILPVWRGWVNTYLCRLRADIGCNFRGSDWIRGQYIYIYIERERGGGNQCCQYDDDDDTVHRHTRLKKNLIDIRVKYFFYLIPPSPVSWGCRIHWLHLCRGVRLHQPVFWIWHLTASDGEIPVLEFLRMWSTPSVPLLPGPLWPGVVEPYRDLSMGQIEMFVNKWLMSNWIS